MSTLPTPSLAEILRRYVREALIEVHTCMPGIVVRYDHAKQLADVRPMVKRRFIAEDGAPTIEELPIVPDVPVAFPGSPRFRMAFPLEVGDPVLLQFSEAALDKWLDSKTGKPVDPQDDRRHDLTDAFAYPGVRAVPDAYTGLPAFPVIGVPDEGNIEFDGEEVRIRAGGTAVALALKSDVDHIRTQYNAHTHSGGVGVPSDHLISPLDGTTVLKGQ